MKTIGSMLAPLALVVLASSYLAIAAIAQQPPAPAPGQARGQQGPPQPMSFFVTSVGKGDGANVGGLAGADAHCQALASAAGRGSAMWHADLSTQGSDAA